MFDAEDMDEDEVEAAELNGEVLDRARHSASWCRQTSRIARRETLRRSLLYETVLGLEEAEEREDLPVELF